MHTPDIFKDSDPVQLLSRIREYPLGTLILNCNGELDANHLPFVLEQDKQSLRLLAHIPRANPLSNLPGSRDAMVIFHGPQGYISPALYATKAEQGRVVPTWNYAVTHVHGQLRIVDDPLWVEKQLRQLTEQQEQGSASPWSMDDAPEDYIRRLTQALVGIEVCVTRMEGKAKASQNQPARNQASVLAGLGEDPAATSLKQMMAAILKPD